MSKDLSLEIGVSASISKDTAELALKVVNDNNLTIKITPYSDKDGGTMKFETVRYPVREKEK